MRSAKMNGKKSKRMEIPCYKKQVVWRILFLFFFLALFDSFNSTHGLFQTMMN